MSRDTTRRENRQHYAPTAVSDFTSSNSSPHGIRINIESDDSTSTDSEWATLGHRTSFSGRRISYPPAVGRSVPREMTPQQVEVNPVLPQHDTLSRPSRPHVKYSMPITQRGHVPSGPHHVPELSRGYTYGPLPGPTPTAYPSHFFNYPEPVTGRPSVHNLHQRPSNHSQALPPRRTSNPHRSTNQQAQQHQNPSQHQNPQQQQNPLHYQIPPYYENVPQYQNLPHYQTLPHYQNPQHEQPGLPYPYGNPFAHYQQPFQHSMMPYFHTSLPYVPPQDSPNTTALDVDKIRVEAQLEIMKAIEHKTKLADEQKELEARVRKEAEEEVQRRFEATAREQEEAIKKAELIKFEAEKKAREELQAKQRAEIDRERLAMVQAKRLEDDLRTKIRREREAKQDMRETRARQSEELESRAMESMLQRMEEVTSLAKRKMLRDLGMEIEAVDEMVERSIFHGTERHTRQSSDTSERTQTTGEEPIGWQQSAEAHITMRSRSRSQFTLHARRNQTVTREQSSGEKHEQPPGRSMDNPRVFQRPRRAFPFKSRIIDDSTTTDSESRSTRPQVPPHAPFPPGNSSYTDSETRSSDRTHTRHTSSGSTKSGDSCISYANYSQIDERHPRSEYYPPPYPPPVQELADEIIEVLMYRLAEWQGPDPPTSQPSSYFDQPRRGRSFSARSEPARGGVRMAQSYSSESTRTPQTDSRDRLVSPPPKPASAAIPEEPFQPLSSLNDGSSASEVQTCMDSTILATFPDSDTSHTAGTSDDSVAGVKHLMEDVTKINDAHVTPNAEVDASLLEDSIRAGGQMCTLM